MTSKRELVVQGASRPTRRPGSVRRTSTIMMRWPGEHATQLWGYGATRDLLTPERGAARIVDSGGFEVRLHPLSKEVLAISSTPELPELQRVVGVGRGIRSVLAATVPQERDSHSALFFLLDDLSGATLVSPVAMTRFLSHERWVEIFGERKAPPGVCTGYAPGANWEREDPPMDRTRPMTEDFGGDEDLDAWHEMPEFDEPHGRRARRIDAWHEGDRALVDAWFQDSSSDPSGERVVVHEYRVWVVADAVTYELLGIDVATGALPFPECPLAVRELPRMSGVRLTDLRDEVPARLKGVLGCTHLNDVVRGLADVPALLSYLPSGPTRAVS
jgi:hypothetical protein